MKENIYKFLVIVCVLMIGILLIPHFNRVNSSVIAYNDSKNEILPQNEILALREKYNNNDIVGTLEIPGTDYKTVVTQAKDNTYYLRKNLNKTYERGGTPFLDYRVDIDSSKKLLIYGHNSKYIDMPFKILENYYDENYLNNHKYIILNTLNGTKKYEIFSIYIEPSNWSYLQVDFKNEKVYSEHLKMFKNKSMIDTNVNITGDEDILVLQTCSTKKEYQKYKKKFLLVISRKVEG